MRRAIVLILGLLLLAGCGLGADASAPPTAIPVCSTKDGKKVYDLVKQYGQQWDDANELASTGTRMTLGPQVADLQRIRREVQVQEYPPCGQRAQSLLVASMDSYINGYLSFLRQDPDSAVSSAFLVGRSKQDEFVIALGELRGIPAPTPTATVRPSPTTVIVWPTMPGGAISTALPIANPTPTAAR